MELSAVRVGPSPLDGRHTRLTGEVAYDDRPGRTEEYWFDVDGDLADSLSRTGNPWLACLLPLAAKLGEPLRLCVPVDRLLARNARELTAVWKSWYPDLHPVEVTAESIDGWPAASGSRAAAFFSAGVDSFFTALRSLEPGALPVDDLLTVRGFDIKLSEPDSLERRRARIETIAASLGKGLVEVATNLRSTRLKEANWGRHWHGCGLASAGLALEGRYRRLLIGSTFQYTDLLPLGSHPLTDPLLSTSRTQVVHDGATHDRFGKLEYLSRHEIALSNLHVCYRQGTDDNCGACEKCLRTMAALEILGRLGPGGRFPAGRLDLSRVRRVFMPRASTELYYQSLRAQATARNRPDVARAVDGARRRSRVLRRLLGIPKWLSRRRGVWRVAGPLRRALLADRII